MDVRVDVRTDPRMDLRMRPEIKFCGLTRPEDACEAVALGAAYLGVIFAPSPRRCTVEQAQAIFDAVETRFGPGAKEQATVGWPRGEAALGAANTIAVMPKRVGVFAMADATEIARIVRVLHLDIVQLHEPWTPSAIQALREATGCGVWGLVPVGPDGLGMEAHAIAMSADAILLDTKVDGQLGGTGRTFDWGAVGRQERQLLDLRPVILAGGLHPNNVSIAIATLRPDVVDVSSGVEASPGVKDHARMRAFADAVRGVALG